MNIKTYFSSAFAGVYSILSVITTEQMHAQVSEMDVTDGVDHASLLASLGPQQFEQGKQIYESLCVNCHGSDGKTPSLPIARAFGVGPFKFGSEPYQLFRTLSDGNGLMGPQTWMTPEERYSVIHYIRETFMKPLYPGYREIDQAYLDRFPKVTKSKLKPERAKEQRDRDYGGALSSQLRVKTDDGSVEDFSSVLTLQLSDSVTMAFDLHRMRQAALWEGGFLDLSGTQHQRPRGEFLPLIDGQLRSGLQTYGWLFDAGQALEGDSLSSEKLLFPRGPLPRSKMNYRGYYRSSEGIVLSYDIRERGVFELVRARVSEPGVSHTFRVEPGKSALHLVMGESFAEGVSGMLAPDAHELRESAGSLGRDLIVSSSVPLAVASGGDSRWIAIGVQGDTSELSWEIDGKDQIVLRIPASERAVMFELRRASGQGSQFLYSFQSFMKMQRLREREVPDPSRLVRGAPSSWQTEIRTKVKLGDSNAAYQKDFIGLPEPNPWNAWMRTAALDFFDDGRMAVTTHGGDVWIVTGLEKNEASWKRYAAGLYEPFGILAVGDTLYVTCKDRIVRLHDLNGDAEADFYESFYADWDVSSFFHAFNFDLQRDQEGFFYYAKSGQYTDFKLPGAVIRVAPDGGSSEVYATGFRTPNGMGMLPDGRVTVGDNQGNWIPASKISLIRPGGFYGYVNNLQRKGRWAPDGGRLALDKVAIPEQFERPIIWMPQEIDSSCGGQVWVDDDRWGPLSDRLIHTSFGKARLFYLLLQEVEDVVQGALVRLPFQFMTGVQRAKVNPADGQLYAVGLHGWNGGWPKELGEMQHGGVFRVRYSGGEFAAVESFALSEGCISLTLSVPVDRSALRQTGKIEAQAWNYRWAQRYGSNQYSVLDPERMGRDQLRVDDVQLDALGTELRLLLPELKPCDQLLLKLDLPLVGGERFKEEILFTVNQLAENGLSTVR